MKIYNVISNGVKVKTVYSKREAETLVNEFYARGDANAKYVVVDMSVVEEQKEEE